MFRGVPKVPTRTDDSFGVKVDWAISKSNRNRNPTDTEQIGHEIADGFFLRAFGWRARSEGVFATGRYKEARGYGDPFIMIPIGDFNILWSDKVVDMYSLFTEVNHHYDNHLREVGLVEIDQEDYENGLQMAFEEALEDAHYHDANLAGAILSQNEIMIDCDEYVLIRVGHSNKTKHNQIQHDYVIDTIADAIMDMK